VFRHLFVRCLDDIDGKGLNVMVFGRGTVEEDDLL
jgi:hypothetical protein